MKLLLRDYEQAFTNCTTMTKGGTPVRIRHFQFPDGLGANSEVDTDEVMFIVDNLSNGDRQLVSREDLLFLEAPKEYGWAEYGDTCLYVSMTSQRQWRKGLTSRRIHCTRIRGGIVEETGELNLVKTTTRMELDSRFMKGLFGARNRRVGTAVAVAIKRYKHSMNRAVARINSNHAIMALSEAGPMVALLEDSAVGIYLQDKNALIVHPDNECFVKQLQDVYDNIVFSESMEKVYERLG